MRHPSCPSAGLQSSCARILGQDIDWGISTKFSSRLLAGFHAEAVRRCKRPSADHHAMASVKGFRARVRLAGRLGCRGVCRNAKGSSQLSADAGWRLLTCPVWAVPKQGCATGVGVGVLQVVQGFCGGKVDGAGVDC